MNHNDNIKTIRLLLRQFYDGSISSADTERLTIMIVNEPELPSDLKADREFLSALRDASHRPIDIPTGLEARISAAIDASNTRRRQAMQRIAIWNIAAAIAVAVIAGIALFKSPARIPSDNLVYQPTNNLPIQTTPVEQQRYPIAQTDTDPDTHTPIANPDTHAGIKTTTSQKSTMKIVTDPEEAAYYTKKAYTLLAENFSKADKACDIAERQLSDISNTLTHILK